MTKQLPTRTVQPGRVAANSYHNPISREGEMEGREVKKHLTQRRKDAKKSTQA
jgi:hypothetical protein